MVESVTATSRLDGPTGPSRGGPPNRLVVNGRYEVDLDDLLGAGGMATVYRGRDLRTRRGVAMRTLRTEYRQDPALRARFRDETRLQAFAAHPNIARVFDFYQETDACWAVHELVDGRSLRDLLDQNGVFAPADVANVLDQIADALADLHGRGVVHLDVNPRNVLVTAQGIVKLIDFGLAQTTGTVQEAIGGLTFGTAAYLSPEQAAGEPLGPAADTYALGCVVYELLTGSPPFSTEGDGRAKREVIEAHLHLAPRPLSLARPDLDLPESLDDVVGWALAKAPADRYRAAPAFARLFRAAVEDRTLSSSATTAPVSLIDVPPARPRSPIPGGFRRPVPVDPWRSFTGAPGGDASPPDGGGSASRPSGPDPGAVASSPPWVVIEERPRRGRAARFLGLPYRVGGRVVRRTRWLRRLAARLAFLLLLANVVLAGLLVALRGPEALFTRTASLEAGATARVVEDVYTMRAGPGLDTVPLAPLERGTRLDVTGPAEAADGLTWWPVRTTLDGETVSGHIAEPGIVAVQEGVAAEAWADARDRLAGLRSDAESWLTGE